jgi:nitrous oxide reductase
MTQLPREASTSASSTSFPPYVYLPTGCVKPVDGFLIIANQNGYNDSIQHGAPSKQWPIINVKQGTTVRITVCNADIQAHGFQVTHYSDSNIQTVTPGEVIHVSFVANSVGDFDIYCEIFCSIHIFMQNGLLRVTA